MLNGEEPPVWHTKPLWREDVSIRECECLEDHAILRTEEEYFSHTNQFPYHRIVPRTR